MEDENGDKIDSSNCTSQLLTGLHRKLQLSRIPIKEFLGNELKRGLNVSHSGIDWS